MHNESALFFFLLSIVWDGPFGFANGDLDEVTYVWSLYEGKSGKRKFNKVDLTCYPTKYNLSVLHASFFIALINSSPYQSIFVFMALRFGKQCC